MLNANLGMEDITDPTSPRKQPHLLTYQRRPQHHLDRHILDQNAAIAAGTLSGLSINLKVLGIGNGLTVKGFFSKSRT